jgi:hypothetical protein
MGAALVSSDRGSGHRSKALFLQLECNAVFPGDSDPVLGWSVVLLLMV